MRLKEKTRLTSPECKDTVYHLAFVPEKGGEVRPFRAGQYLRFSVPASKEPAPAYFAIASEPEHTSAYEIVAKQVPGMASFLADMEVGKTIEVEGPIGRGFDLSPFTKPDVYLIGVGTGIAPLRSVWRSIIRNRASYGKVAIYAGFLSPVHCLLTDELQALAEYDMSVSVSLEAAGEQWQGAIGYVQDALRADAPSSENAVACLAGMSAMVDACTETLHTLGFNDSRILLNY